MDNIVRYRKLDAVAEKHHQKLLKITKDLFNLPKPYFNQGGESLNSPYDILPTLGSKLSSTLRHYEIDRHDQFAFGLYISYIDMRFWRVANLLQVILETIPMILPLYDSESIFHSSDKMRYYPSQHEGWETLWNDIFESNNLNYDLASEIFAHTIITTSFEELDKVYRDFKYVINESTWDL
jgi:hypothetical protein